jgi:hypothetical protein
VLTLPILVVSTLTLAFYVPNSLVGSAVVAIGEFGAVACRHSATSASVKTRLQGPHTNSGTRTPDVDRRDAE